MERFEVILDNIVNNYVDSLNIDNDKNKIREADRLFISNSVKSELQRGFFIKFKKSLLIKAKEEAEKEKRKIISRFKITLIIETIFIAFLVGIIVNQVSSLLPVQWYIILIALILCFFMILINIGKMGKD